MASRAKCKGTDFTVGRRYLVPLGYTAYQIAECTKVGKTFAVFSTPNYDGAMFDYKSISMTTYGAKLHNGPRSEVSPGVDRLEDASADDEEIVQTSGGELKVHGLQSVIDALMEPGMHTVSVRSRNLADGTIQLWPTEHWTAGCYSAKSYDGRNTYVSEIKELFWQYVSDGRTTGKYTNDMAAPDEDVDWRSKILEAVVENWGQKEAERMRSWTFPDCIVNELGNDNTTHPFQIVFPHGEYPRYQMVYPDTVEDMNECIRELDEGISPVDNWKEDNGDLVCWENSGDNEGGLSSFFEPDGAPRWDYIADTASNWYDGGWRASDRDWLMDYYGLNGKEADAICEKLAEYEERAKEAEE